MHHGIAFGLCERRQAGASKMELEDAFTRLVCLDEVLAFRTERFDRHIEFIRQYRVEFRNVRSVVGGDVHIPVHRETGHSFQAHSLAADQNIACARVIESPDQFVH